MPLPQLQTGCSDNSNTNQVKEHMQYSLSTPNKSPVNLAISRYEWACQCLHELLPLAPSPVVSDIGAGGGEMRSLTEASGGKWQGFDLFPQFPEIRY